jgi:hypothetical protein
LVEVALVLIGSDTVECQNSNNLGARQNVLWKREDSWKTAMVVFGDSHGRHGTDIEAKQATTNNGDGRDNVYVSNFIHDGRPFSPKVKCLLGKCEVQQ